MNNKYKFFVMTVVYSPLIYLLQGGKMYIGGDTMDICIKFGNRCRSLREAMKTSQEKFALHIEMDRTYYSSIENGKRNVSIKNIEKISKGFGITMDELLKGI